MILLILFLLLTLVVSNSGTVVYHHLLDSYLMIKIMGGSISVQFCRIFLVISVFFVIFFELLPSTVFSIGDIKMST